MQLFFNNNVLPAVIFLKVILSILHYLGVLPYILGEGSRATSWGFRRVSSVAVVGGARLVWVVLEVVEWGRAVAQFLSGESERWDLCAKRGQDSHLFVSVNSLIDF